MNWQIPLYVASLFLTCALTGFLALYAWRQAPRPGVRTFAALAGSECLLALMELLSVTSRTEAQARFWFNMRFFFFSIAAVLWLIFTLEYNEKGEWLSRPVVVGVFLLPILTQIMLWSNPLHGLWLKQDITFRQFDSFWIADPSRPMPGFGFMVFLVYSLLLLLAGIGVFMFAAWPKQHEDRVQALLLSTRTLVILLAAECAIFNLLPGAGFNLFVPGIGIASLFTSLAVLRYRFLKNIPPSTSAAHVTDYAPPEKRYVSALVLIFILFTSGILAGGDITYEDYEKHFRSQVESQLDAIASLKVDELQKWRAERLADANLFYKNENFSEQLRVYLDHPQDADARAKVLTWLDKILATPEYDLILLLDPQGVVRLSIPSAPETSPADLVEQASASLRLNQVKFVDLHRLAEDNAIRMAILVPIFETQNHQPLGTLILRIDPNVYLYPFLQRWPVPSESAETLIVRREGQGALYLNPLHYQPGAALELSIPLENTRIPAVQAVLGREGIIEGNDYRGEPVLADIHAIPDSPWFLVAKIDMREIYAPLSQRLWQTLAFTGALILVVGAGLFVVWRQQRVRYYRAQAETLDALRESEERYRGLYENSAIGIYRTTPEGRILLANPSLVNMLGYSSLEELSTRDLAKVGYEPSYPRAHFLELMEKEGEVRGLESAWQRQDGSFLFVSESARAIRNPQGEILYYDGTIEDITESKQAEEALRESEERYRLLVEQSPVIVYVDEVGGHFHYLSPQLEKVTGYKPEEFMRQRGVWKSIVHPEDLPRLEREYQLGIENGGRIIVEYRVFARDGRVVWLHDESNPFRDPHTGKTILRGVFYDITERKQAEEALVASESKLRALFTAMIDVVIVYDGDGRYLEIAPTNPANLYQPADALLGKTIREILPNEPADAIIAGIRESLQSGQVVNSEYALQIGGKEVWFSASASPLSENRVIWVAHNITERKQVEEKLAASEIRYRRLFEAARDGILILDAETGVIVDVNPFLVEMLGFPKEKILGKELWELGFFKDIAANKANFLELQKKEYIRYEDLPLETANGGRIHVEFISNVYQVNHLKVVQCNIRDVTERKQAEEQLRRSEANLKQAQAVAHVGSWVWRIQDNWLEWSDEMYRIFGIEEEGFSGLLSDVMAQAIHPEDRAEVERSNRSVMEDRKPIPLEYRIVWPNGVIRTVWAEAGELILDDAGKPLILTGIVQDITERKRIEQLLARYTERLEEVVDERTRELRATQEQLVRQERLATLGQLAGSIGHELRTPLGIITNAIYILKMERPQENDPRREYLDMIDNEAHTADKIITDLLDFTRIKSPDRQAVSVSELVRQTLERNPVPPAVEVTLEIPADLPPIFADPHHVIQILGNLTVNACQAIPETGKLNLSAQVEGDMITIAVRDTGIGIPPDRMQKLFEPLFTTKVKGIGLGLAVSQKLAEANDGRIEVESETGKGSTFTLLLPIYKEFP